MAHHKRTFIETIKWRLYGKRNRKRANTAAQCLFNDTLACVPPNSLVIDCGANIGDISDRFIKKGLRVIAFEPDPLALAKLRERFASNDMISIYPYAVGSNARTATLYRNDKANNDNFNETQSSSIQLHTHLSGSGAATVKVIDLVEFIRNLKEPVSILKMDIEGSEVETLNALLDSGLTQTMRLVIVETHERFSHGLAKDTKSLRARIANEGHRNINLDWH